MGDRKNNVFSISGMPKKFGGDDGGDGMDSRITRLESDVVHIRTDISEIKTDIREIRQLIFNQTLWMVGSIIASAAVVAAIMAMMK